MSPFPPLITCLYRLCCCRRPRESAWLPLESQGSSQPSSHATVASRHRITSGTKRRQLNSLVCFRRERPREGPGEEGHKSHLGCSAFYFNFGEEFVPKNKPSHLRHSCFSALKIKEQRSSVFTASFLASCSHLGMLIHVLLTLVKWREHVC